jgi:hypothetical protein
MQERQSKPSYPGEHPMATHSLEERVTALEAEVMQLKRAWKGATNMSVSWWERRFGTFKDDLMYDEAMRLGAVYRQSQPAPEDEDVPLRH